MEFQQEIEDSSRSYLERVVFSSLVVEDSGVYQCGGRQLHLHVEGKALYLLLCHVLYFYPDEMFSTSTILWQGCNTSLY